MVLMVPTVYWVHLRLPRMRPVVESITMLPFVMPPIVLVVGLFDFFKFFSPRLAARDFVFSPKFLVAAYVDALPAVRLPRARRRRARRSTSTR